MQANQVSRLVEDAIEDAFNMGVCPECICDPEQTEVDMLRELVSEMSQAGYNILARTYISLASDLALEL